MTRRKRSSARRSTPSDRKPARGGARSLGLPDVAILVALLGVTLFTFGNAFDGEFVYDDKVQIVRNPLVLESSRLGEALLSDVWAFKGPAAEGDGGERTASSNYWRPTFVLWLAANHRAFGLADTTPWHVANVLLHFVVLVLAFGFLRELDVGRMLTAAVLLIFATHPAHVESVTWISGSPDVLLATAVLGVLWLVAVHARRPAWYLLAPALAAHAIAVGAKELGIMVPALVFVTVLVIRRPSTRLGAAVKAAGRVTLPFVAVSAVYFFARMAVLGGFELRTAWHHGPLELLLTAPSLLAFYLRQIVFPLWVGPNYPLRAVTPDNVSLLNFVLPVVVCGAFGWLVWRAVRRDAVAWIGTTLFALFLLPAMNINAFLPEQLVHDRYLYLPLLGFLILALPALARALETFGHVDPRRAATVVLIVAMVASVLLAVQSRRYNEAWMTELDLWTWSVRIDPGSAFNHAMLGASLLDEDRLDEARAPLDRAIETAAVTDAYLARGSLNLKQGRLQEAVDDLRQVVEVYPGESRAYEQLALVYQRAGRLDEAARILRAGREAAPRHACAFTSNLGVVLYLAGDKDAALAELEKAATLAPTEFSPGCRNGLYRLGLLYGERGRTDDARQAMQRYLELTETMQDDQTSQFRNLARNHLR